MFEMQTWLWILFNLLIIGMLILDLGVLNRKTHVISSKEALFWSLVWVAVSLGFNVVIYFVLGAEKALEFFTGYLIEKALSVDNIFAILGLRALYFLLASVLNMFAYLKFGLSVILVFVGVKMLLAGTYKIPIAVSLSVIFGILLVSIIISLISSRRTAVASATGKEAKAVYSDIGSLVKTNPQQGGSNGKTECSSLKDIDKAQSTYHV